MAKDKYKWKQGAPLPALDIHSRNKHQTLENYLKEYLNVTTGIPFRDNLKWLLVDGFSGGGMYENGLCGSPFIILETTIEHALAINDKRGHDINFDFNYIFIEKDKDNYQCLRYYMEQHDYYDQNRKKISILNRSFSDSLKFIVARAKSFMPQVQNCLIFLDQCGYTDVTVANCSYLMQQLKKAEIILIFAMDFLLDFLNCNSIDTLENIFGPLPGAFKREIHNLAATKKTEDNKWKNFIANQLYEILVAKIERDLGQHVFVSKYFIQSSTGSSKSYWFIHICRHQKAREVMQAEYWEVANHFRDHAQPIMGWKQQDSEAQLFGEYFTDQFRVECGERVGNRILGILESNGHPITKDSLWRQVANGTPILRGDFDIVLKRLIKAEEIMEEKDLVSRSRQRKFFL